MQAYSIAYELRHDQYLKAFYLLDKMNIKFHNYKGFPGDLQRFILPNQQIIRKDPRLIWNVDETSSASNKKYKVLFQKEMLPLTEINNLSEHYTGLFPFNASGNKLIPTIILPDICFLPDELKGLHPHFFSQKSGWMTNF